MTMMEFFKNSYSSWDAGLLATDISSRVLATAEAGRYSSDNVMNIPAEMRRRYLKQIDPETWEFQAKVRREITFRRFNLMNTFFPFKKQFNVIFCRNVMIYFDKQTRQSLVKRMYDATAPGGYLFIGHSESIRANDCPYDYIQPAVFKKRKA
jgi:chemotaxis protein methyltransferase CheR